MSTGLGCKLVQVGQDEWWYELESAFRRDEYDKYGPFRTYRAAQNHLRANHANPGGYMVNRLEGFECEHEMDDGECYKCGRDDGAIAWVKDHERNA